MSLTEIGRGKCFDCAPDEAQYWRRIGFEIAPKKLTEKNGPSSDSMQIEGTVDGEWRCFLLETVMATKLAKHPIHLGLNASACSEPEFTGMQWYAEYGARHASDGKEGRLVSMHTFDESWDQWEMHPEGSEVVVCVAGEITLVQEIEGQERRITLSAGEYAINDPGVWHTADVKTTATGLFITAGMGTQNRERT